MNILRILIQAFTRAFRRFKQLPRVRDAIRKTILALYKFSFLRKLISKYTTINTCNLTAARPRPFGLWSPVPDERDTPLAVLYDHQSPVGDYTSWPMLVDKRFSARHIKPVSQQYIDDLPEAEHYKNIIRKTPDDKVTELFKRPEDGKIILGRSSTLFVFFAQWFTDSIMRFDPDDRRKTTSTHNIDLCQIYGLDEQTATILRSHESGRLRCQEIPDPNDPTVVETFPDLLMTKDGKKPKEIYKDLPYVKCKKTFKRIIKNWDKERLKKLYATGLERGNISVGYVAISTIFLREHNRICCKLLDDHPDWTDERLFQTARMINIVLLMKLIVEDYVNHIGGDTILIFDPSFAEKQKWYRAPWISVEFDLLYRWHSIVPHEIKVGEQKYLASQYLRNNDLLETAGLSTIIDAVSRESAGELLLKNTPSFLWWAEYNMIRMGRDFRIASFNDYRERFKLPPLKSFAELTDDAQLNQEISELYEDNIDKLEFTVGLYAEKHYGKAIFGDLMGRMIGYDALTQIYTNPLLAKEIYTEETFSSYGLKLIKDTKNVQDLVDRNTAKVNGQHPLASFQK